MSGPHAINDVGSWNRFLTPFSRIHNVHACSVSRSVRHIMIGGLVGAPVALLLAPQSGCGSREQL